MIDVNHQLLEKYNVSIPRYTSYPTANQLKPIEESRKIFDLYQSTIKGSSYSPKISLYLHLPYCPKLCYFCACNKIISLDPGDKLRYLQLLEKEFSFLKEALPINAKIVQLHLGGGSPSYLDNNEFTLLDSIIADFPISNDIQKSIEIDPRTFSVDKLNQLYKSGFRRFSLGIQDFDENVQKLVNRIQPFYQVEELVDAIREKKGNTINFDLIYGLPGQTYSSFNQTIEKVITLQPERIALYGYAQVSWKAKAQNTLKKYGAPSAQERLSLFLSAQSRFEEAGYIYIGLDHFALPNDDLSLALKDGSLRRNFMGYTTIKGDLLLGCGTSAISDFGDFLSQNALEITQYESLLSSDCLPVNKLLIRSDQDQLRALIIEKIMCNRSIKTNDIAAHPKWTNCYERIFNEGLLHLEPLARDGLVELSKQEIQVTKLGSYFLRNIASAFDSYFNTSVRENRLFSSAI